MAIEIHSPVQATFARPSETHSAQVVPGKTQTSAQATLQQATGSLGLPLFGPPQGEANNGAKADKVANAAELDEVASMLAEVVSMTRKGLDFRVDEVHGSPVVSVTDMETGELIRQIPSEEALALAEKMSELAGLLIKTEA